MIDNAHPVSGAPPLSIPTRSLYLSGLLLALAGSVFFSAKAIVAKLLYRHGLDAVSLIALRMLLSMPVFLAVAAWTWRREPRLSAGDLARIAGLGLVGYYASSMLDFLGLQYISAGLERLLLFLAPSFVLLIGLVALKRAVTPRQWLSLVVAYAGVVLVFWHDLHFGGDHTLLGATLVLGAAAVYAVYLLLSGELLRRVGSVRLVALAMSFFLPRLSGAVRPAAAVRLAVPAEQQRVVAVAAQCRVVHGATGVHDHDRGRPHRRRPGVAGGNDRAGLDPVPGLLAARRTDHRPAAHRNHAGAGRDAAAVVAHRNASRVARVLTCTGRAGAPRA